jgi:hypothetical protein
VENPTYDAGEIDMYSAEINMYSAEIDMYSAEKCLENDHRDFFGKRHKSLIMLGFCAAILAYRGCTAALLYGLSLLF